MGQQCSCLQHPPKYQRRVSDASDADDDGATELGSIHVHRSGDELAGLLATDASSKAALQSQKEEEKLGEGGGLLATEQLMLERLDDGLLSRGSSQQVLRSYQAATGVVDPGELDLECIMCLDTFSSDNPKLRTLCNCGMNRTNFHLSCLLEWLNRDANCPVCRTYLYYEDL